MSVKGRPVVRSAQGWARGASRAGLMDRRVGGAGWGMALALGIALLGAGCATGPGGRGSRAGAGGPVEQLELLLTPLAVDLDGKPGADGFGARVYAGSRRSALGQTLAEGRLEFLMFDGVVRAEEVAAAKPLRVWSYEARELAPYAQQTTIGRGYRFALAWGEQRPRRERITVVARYTGPNGVVLSAPGSIPMVLK